MSDDDVMLVEGQDGDVVPVEGAEVEEEGNERLDNPEYKVWKKNAPLLYDLMISEVLEHPSLTVSFLPGRTVHADRQTQRLLMGTNTFGAEQEMLLIARMTFPVEDTEIESQYRLRGFDPERNEIGGYGLAPHKDIGTLAVDIKIPHKFREVNRARYCPLKPTMIATKAATGDVCVYDYTNYSSVHLQPKHTYDMREYEPSIRFTGHQKEGYGLAWSPYNASHLLSGSYDNTVLLFDVESASGTPKTAGPKQIYNEHTDKVEDVAWHMHSPHLFGSCGDDRRVLFWDLRTHAAFRQSTLHDDEVNSICFDPHSDFLVATASTDGTVRVCDMRQMDEALFTLRGHRGKVLQVAWSPHEPSVLASAGEADHRVLLWDLSRVGLEQRQQGQLPGEGEEEGGEAAPPEVMFVHAGHLSPVVDLAWNPEMAMVLATVEEDGVVQVWSPAENMIRL